MLYQSLTDMTDPSPPPDWVLLVDSVVRKSDIRRIDVNTQFGTMIGQVFLTYGPPIRVTATDPGAGWLYAQYEAAKAASAAFVLRKRTESEEDD
jgi:hypothetical protein